MGHDLRIALGRSDLPLRSNISGLRMGQQMDIKWGVIPVALASAGVSFLSSYLNIDQSESKRSNPEFVESRECMFSVLAVVKQGSK